MLLSSSHVGKRENFFALGPRKKMTVQSVEQPGRWQRAGTPFMSSLSATQCKGSASLMAGRHSKPNRFHVMTSDPRSGEKPPPHADPRSSLTRSCLFVSEQMWLLVKQR